MGLNLRSPIVGEQTPYKAKRHLLAAFRHTHRASTPRPAHPNSATQQQVIAGSDIPNADAPEPTSHQLHVHISLAASDVISRQLPKVMDELRSRPSLGSRSVLRQRQKCHLQRPRVVMHAHRQARTWSRDGREQGAHEGVATTAGTQASIVLLDASRRNHHRPTAGVQAMIILHAICRRYGAI